MELKKKIATGILLAVTTPAFLVGCQTAETTDDAAQAERHSCKGGASCKNHAGCAGK